MDPVTAVAILEGCFKLAAALPSIVSSVQTIAAAVEDMIHGSAHADSAALLARIDAAKAKVSAAAGGR